jgi:hypothetical protein
MTQNSHHPIGVDNASVNDSAISLLGSRFDPLAEPAAANGAIISIPAKICELAVQILNCTQAEATGEFPFT